MTDALEKAFDDFLDRQEYDAAQAAIFALVRAAFLAGWQAAKEAQKASPGGSCRTQ